MIRHGKLCALIVVGLGVLSHVAAAAPTAHTVNDDFVAAVLAIDPDAEIGVEDFNLPPLGELGAGPTPYHGFDLTLEGIGNGGSFTGIIPDGEHDGTQALDARVVLDTADFELFPGFFIQGEGVKSMVFNFTVPVIGFAVEWHSTTTNDGVQITVNGVEFDLAEHVPNDNLIDGDGFLGIVDPNGISSFVLTSDDLETSSTFEDFEMDEILFALTVCAESAPPAPDVIGSDVVIKNRYLSFSAGTAGASQAIRVSFDALPPPFHVWNSSTMWVGPVSAVSESPGSVVPIPGFPTFNAAQLQCAPHFDDWTQYGVIHTFHEGVVPGGGYTIQVIDATCDLGSEASFSAPLGLPTAIFGDAVKDCNTLPCPPPNGAVDIIDCFAIIQRFVGVSTAIGKARADLEPSCVDLAMNILDVFQCINAINGFGYPFGTTLASPCNSKCGNPLP